jgi:hypothetical protein
VRGAVAAGKAAGVAFTAAGAALAFVKYVDKFASWIKHP